MGACIEAAATSTHRGRLFHRSLAADAAKLCLSRAHHAAGDLDLMINTGIYNDHHERSAARLSFDVHNGGAGFVTAAQLADGLVASGSAHLAMIVADDADPSPRTSRSYPFQPAGGAVMLAPGKLGFQRFAIRTFPEEAALFESRRVHRVLEIREAPAFEDRCVDHAAAIAREVLADAGLRPREVDVLVASQHPRCFALRVAHALGVPEDRLPYIAPALRDTHTAGPIGALESALETRMFAHARNALFVTAGAGITIGVAWYRGCD
jgi:3-oxoacyl-[acyl-carrier-protein] synthase-3